MFLVEEGFLVIASHVIDCVNRILAKWFHLTAFPRFDVTLVHERLEPKIYECRYVVCAQYVVNYVWNAKS